MSMVVEATLLDVHLPAEPRSASRARRAVLEALSGIAVDKDAVGVVVSEAVTNAVVHAYRDREQPGLVHVSASLDDDGLEVAVDDDGLGMRPRVDSPGVGLGLPLMGDLADRVEVAVDDDGLGMGPRTDSPGVGLGLPLMGDLADRVDITSRGPGTRIAAFFSLMGAAGPHGRPLARHVSGRAERQLATLV